MTLTPSEFSFGCNQAGDLGIERVDMALDLFEPLFALALQDSDGEVFLAVLERGSVTHQAVTGIDEFGQLGLLGTLCRSDRGLQGGSHARQQHGVDAIRFGERACGLGKAPGALRVELDAGPVGQCGLKRAVVCSSSRFEGDPFNLPLVLAVQSEPCVPWPCWRIGAWLLRG